MREVKKLKFYLPLALILLAAALPRFYHISHGFGFHPDERHMIMVAEKLSLSNLNPKSFAYGSFPYYLLWLTSRAAGLFSPSATSYDGLFVVGRAIAALFALVGIALTFFIAQTLFRDRVVSLLAAFLLAANVFHLQLSRFYTVDVIMTTLGSAALLAMLWVARGGGAAASLLSGVFTGLALSTKITALFLAAPFLAAWFAGARKRGGILRLEPLLLGLLCAAAAAAAFLLTEPYAILDFDTFMAQTREQTSMVKGDWRPPYVIQFAHTAPYFYHLKQMLLYTMGWPLALAVLIGTLHVLIRSVRRLDADGLVALAYVLPAFLLIAQYQVKFPRYLIAFYPLLFCFAAYTLVAMAGRAAVSAAHPPVDRVPAWGESGLLRMAAPYVDQLKRLIARFARPLKWIVLLAAAAVVAGGAARMIFFRQPVSVFEGGQGREPGRYQEMMGVAVGLDGSIWAVDMLNARVQRYDREGKFIDAFGELGQAAGRFHEPRGIAIDEQGDVYVMDTWNSRVQKFDARGRFIREFRAEPGLYGAKGVAARAGRVAVADSGLGRVVVFDSEGRQLQIIGGKGSDPGQLQEPSGITFGHDNSLYVLDSGNNRIQRFQADGAAAGSWTIDGWSGSTLKEGFLATGPDGSVYLADPLFGRVLRLSPAAPTLKTVAEGLAGPTGIAFQGERLLVGERPVGRVVPVEAGASAR